MGMKNTPHKDVYISATIFHQVVVHPSHKIVLPESSFVGATKPVEIPPFSSSETFSSISQNYKGRFSCNDGHVTTA
jgi:hypothetical protein